MKLKNIDWQKIGKNVGGLIRDNAGTLVSGSMMVALALICRKLDIPYQVLTDPYHVPIKTYPEKQASTSIYLIPNNPVEASIAAVANSAKDMDFDSTKERAAEKIMSILGANKDNLNDSTKNYAISMLQSISDTLDFDSTKSRILNLIVKIGKDDF